MLLTQPFTVLVTPFKQTFEYLQAAFDTVQSWLSKLKLVLNATKTKMVLFSNTRNSTAILPNIVTLQGSLIECVAEYKYLGFILDDPLTFKVHIHLVRNLD